MNQMALSTGTRLGPYEILSALGAGGMGEVYRALDTRLDRTVAIKVLNNRFSQRFEGEARAIAALNHPHICTLYDVGPDYLVMEYVEGKPLEGPFDVEETLRLAKQIGEALEEAHRKGIIHMDLKPANIMVTAAGSVKLLDFGLAKLAKSEDADVTRTIEGTLMGTVAYMAPERAKGQPVDCRSDIFSFGAVLYEMFTGRRPFDGDSMASVLNAVLRSDPAPLQAPPALERIVMRCLKKQPAQRFQTMEQVNAALRQVSTSVEQQSPNASPRFANMSHDVQTEVARILSSQHFSHQGRLSRFLEFTVSETLAGHADILKEYAIGMAVFNRGESFDPRTDGIVRVQAAALRARLKKYYASDGVNDPVIIEYNKGSYAPVLRYRSDVDRPSKPARDAAAGPASIAVLPFVNVSPDPENEYFSDGLTEELIGALSNVKNLRVVARTSVFQYKDRSDDIRKIGADLNAHMVLEGSVRKSGDRLRVTVQLIEVTTGYQTWSRTYRVEMKDLFAVQEEIARAIATTLSEGARGSRGRHTANLDAYHDYLKGRFHLNKWTEEGFCKSIEFFETAIEKDPEMAAAWAGLADARFFLACYGRTAPLELMPKARMAAEKATALDAWLAEAHVSLGAVRALYDWDWAGSEEEFRRAIELDPDCAQAYQWWGVLCLMPQGRMQEAETAIQRALDLDPLSPANCTSLGLLYFVQGKHEEAITYFEKALETDPNFYMVHWWLGARVGGRPAIYLQRSKLLKAFAQFRRAGVLPEGDWSDPAKFTYADEPFGKLGKARRMLEELNRISTKQYFSPVMIAAIHVALGESDAAFGWLEKARAGRDPWLAWLGVDRRFDGVRQDQRFPVLLKKIGIDAFARANR